MILFIQWWRKAYVIAFFILCYKMLQAFSSLLTENHIESMIHNL